MPICKTLISTLVCFSLFTPLRAQAPANDHCANASVVVIPGGGYGYGTFISATTDLTNAAGENGEYFSFAAEGHVKSVWYEFTLPTRRSFKVEMVGNNLNSAAITLYRPANCLPGVAALSGTLSGDAGGFIENTNCSEYGTYRVQVTAPAGLNAAVFVRVTLSCPADPVESRYDCPPGAFVFNSGNPLPQNSFSSSGSHKIGCQSLDDTTEYACLPLPDKADYNQSTWYVFTTGARVDLLSFSSNVYPSDAKVGFRLFEGDVRPAGSSGLAQIACEMAREDGSYRYIEFPCLLKPNTTYSLALLFHRDFNNSNNTFTLTARQRGETPAGWPKPVLPPVLAANQLGALPNGGPAKWFDRFDCSASISQNPCPPANPANGTVTIGNRTYNLATWATFTLTQDANVDFRFYDYHYSAALHTRIFKKIPGADCPSPDPATDLAYEFSGTTGAKDCLPAGTYAVQVLSSSVYPQPATSGYWNAWSYANLGTAFEFRFTVEYLPVDGKFMLDTPGVFDSINLLQPLANGVIYAAAPAVFVCKNTVLPANLLCAGAEKAMYRQFNTAQDGLLSLVNLRTDDYPDPPVRYQLFQSNANDLAAAQNAHNPGQSIAGMSDYTGICIDDDDNTYTPAGIDTFCVCATAATYTLASLGDSANVGKGDAPKFRLRVLKTVHDSRTNAETVNLGAVPGSYSSQPDVFSCVDNPGALPPCGNRKKLIFRQFYLPAPAVVTISETGNTTSMLSLFAGQATDAAAALTPLAPGCFQTHRFTDECTPLPAGWYTVVSYGAGPNYTDKRIWNNLGDPADVGKNSRITISLDFAIEPKYNRPAKAYQAGTTDWTPAPPANPNAVTAKLYTFGTEQFCAPDTPFIPTGILSCAPGYNRVAFFVFTITRNSFVQIRGVDQGFYVEVFPFNVNIVPASLLTVQPVYQCMSVAKDYRQLCDLPPGTYTIAVFANDSHKGATLTPALYVEQVIQSRFDDAADAYNVDLVPDNGTWINGRTGDINLDFPLEHPTRDVFSCLTGARPTDPADTRCGTQLNPLIYAPAAIKPLYLPGNPPSPIAQPWRTLWYTFVLEGSGTASIGANILTPGTPRPLMAVYESNLDAGQPWSDLKLLGDAALSSGLTLLDENVDYWCDAEYAFNNVSLTFTKNGCLKNRVRYFLVVSFDADEPNFPNQAVSISIKYDGTPTTPALYDERETANVLNGLGQTQPPYDTVSLAPGNTFSGPAFSLLCYTKNPADPTSGFCGSNGAESAWFRFEVLSTGQFYAALQEIGVANGWFANQYDLTVWRESTPGGPLAQLPLSYEYVSGEHEWISGCIGPGVYYLLVRSCSSIDELQQYRPVIKLADSPGDFCANAIPLDVPGFSPVTASATVDCHTIGTDFGETSEAGMGCLFGPAGKKTTWFRVHVTAGQKMDLNFKFAENLSGSTVNLNHLAYRVFSGSCGALTPVVCSAVGSNSITQNCLGPGDYYVQVALPEKVGNTIVEGTVALTVTATPNNDQNCTPVNPNMPRADFYYSADCQTVTFYNTSTAGTDIGYLWQFPDGATSVLPSPVWTPPGPGDFAVTLTTTNTANGLSASLTKNVPVAAPFAAYQPLPDALICNGTAPAILDATFPGAEYVWSDGSTGPVLTTYVADKYWVIIKKDGCEKRDTAVVSAIEARRNIVQTLCPGDTLTVGNQVFHQGNANGTVTLPGAHPSGCDSLLDVHLDFYPEAIQYLDTTLCAGLSFSLGGQVFSADHPAGQALLPGLAPHGCDLTVNVNAQFTHSVSEAVHRDLCAGETFTYRGQLFSENNPSATLVLPASAPGGCDTTVAITTSFYHPDTAQLFVERCENETFTYGGQVFSAQQPQGFVTLAGQALNGCDSVVRVAVTFLPALETVLVQTLCPGEKVQAGGEIFDGNRLSGTVVLPSANGCDSTVQVQLTALPPAAGLISGTYCHHDTVVIFGQQFTVSNPGGVIIRPGLAPNGCDSIWTIDLYFKPFQTTVAEITGCSGNVIPLQAPPGANAYLWHDGSAQPVLTASQSGVYWVQSFDAQGCVIRLDTFPVQLHPQVLKEMVATICETEIYPFNQQSLSQSGVYEQTFSTAQGCDSTVRLTLTVRDTFFQKTGVEICHDGAFQLPNGQMVSQPGVYLATLPAQNGCDSSWEITVVQRPLLKRTTSVSVCPGLPLPLPWGDTAAAPGQYIRVFQYASGCDSLEWIVTAGYASAIQPGAAVQSDFNGFAISCAAAADGKAGASPAGGTPPWSFLWNTGHAGAQITGLAAGTYTVTVTDALGCTAVQTLALSEPPALNLTLDAADPLCSGETNGRVSGYAEGGVAPYLYSSDGFGFVQNNVFKNLAPGIYTLTAQDANGCETASTTTIETPEDLAVVFDPAEWTIHLGDSLQLKPLITGVADSLAWSPRPDCGQCPEPWVKPFQSTDYRLTIWNAAGCPAEARVRVFVDRDRRVYVPNVFSPDGDGRNDYFGVFAGPEYRLVRRLAVFDRWGNAVFDARDFPPDAARGRWDGRARGQEVTPGVFAWLCVMELADGTVEVVEGGVTVVR